ncbi:unnamed protein product [Caenorhabditis brenneri]
MAQGPAHPLLSLPDDEIIEELREMSLEEILKFSLISERSKDLVKSTQIKSLQTTSKQINKFIKLWQQGSNPCMERLRFEYSNIEEDDVMKGIKHEVIPYNRRRLFKSTGLTNPYVINAGLDFYRIDGVKATIEFTWDWNFSYSDMYFWFDHCIAES